MIEKIAWTILVAAMVLVGAPYLAHVVTTMVVSAYYSTQKRWGRLQRKCEHQTEEQDLWQRDEQKRNNGKNGQ